MQRRTPGEVRHMAGRFEIHRVGDESYRLRLTDSEGNIVAVSPNFKSLNTLLEGIKAMRENAATGVVVDLRHQQA
ncbi:YegP family protein [Arthrobacter sp. AD-310]